MCRNVSHKCSKTILARVIQKGSITGVSTAQTKMFIYHKTEQI